MRIVSGTVTGDGSPKAGIKVELLHDSGSNSLFVWTNATGQYSLTALLNGRYYLRFSDPANTYATIYQDGKPYLTFAQPLTITGKSEIANVNVDLVRGGEIHGTFRSRAGKPLAQVYVTISWQDPNTHEGIGAANTVTDQSGNYQFRALLPGIYRVYFQRNDIPAGQIPFGIFDSKSGQYIPSDISVAGGQTFTADMSVATPIMIYLPVVARD